MSSTSENEDTNLDLSLGISLGSYKSLRGGGGGGGGTDHGQAASVGSGVIARPVLGRRSAGFTMSRLLDNMNYMHPWSLAARQEKAMLERMRARATAASLPSPSSSSSSPVTRVTQMPPVIGWPPVRWHRKNILSLQSSRSLDKGEEKEAKKPKPSESENTFKIKQEERKPAKFVKVNIEGFALGRKIDLMAQDGYDSLFRALRRMFNNFLSVTNHPAKEPETGEEDADPNLTFLYEDSEGDTMLVGDVPWEMFIGSAKRLYISCGKIEEQHQGKEEDGEKKKKASLVEVATT